MRLELRHGLILVFSILMGLSAVFTVTQVLLSQLSRSQQEARLEFQLDNLRADIEANLQLGFPIDEITPAQDLIEEARRNDPTLLALDIFTPDGVSLYSTDRGVIGEPVPPAWLEAVAAADSQQRWTHDSRGEMLLGLPIRNDLGESVAQIVSVTSAQEMEAREGGLQRALILHALWIVPLAAIGALLLSVWLTRRESRRFRQAAARLHGLTVTDSPLTDLEREAARAQREGEQALSRLDTTGRRLEEVGDGL
ncbi:hypothetical protein [Fodinicurvata sediminis]|uniref:hypothetical protein n=1 Tax=Fodinicurvata sediminis TaxID=1121832 RepID=UPI0003B4AFAC|nr:hypothetical protein [Fodinicurvata sediminis]